MSAGYGGGHTQSYAGGSVLSRESGAPPPSAHATAIDALESAVALPGAFTSAELHRTLRRCHGDVMRAALQLREKHAARARMCYDTLNVGLGPLQAELRKGYAHLLEPAPTLLLQLRFFKPSFAEDKLQRQGVGAADGSSSLEDTRRLCVYLMDLAVEAMEESGADGVAVIIDLDRCAAGNLEAKIVTDVLQLVKSWYPECVRHVLLVNGTALTRALSHLLAHVASERTRQRIHVLPSASELRHFLPLDAIPQMYGGAYRLLPPAEWMALQAAIEEVDLASQAPDVAEQPFMTKDARQLNGMQYAACSVKQVVAMKASVLRGPMHRNKSGVAWVKMYAILRPEALLLYEHAAARMPQIIVPVNHEVGVAAASFADAPKGGAFGFRVQVPGVAGGHLLAVGSDAERGNWLQEIQLSIAADAAEVAREHREEEKRQREARDFEALNMISFDDLAPSPQPTAAVGMQQQQQAQSVFSQPQQQQTPPVPPQPTPFFQGGMAPAPMGMMMTTNPTMAPATAAGGYVVAPTFAQQQQYNMVNPMAMGAQQQPQQLVRPPQPVNLPMMMMGQQQAPLNAAQYGGGGGGERSQGDSHA
ncbi:hypothetical protein PybrP1_003092 [[Pythium] brassicae (nom. inval.)]|nr:hypothetical protein PybrP1_003092 [[Pythium] brassicae (nom. inval.)]